MFTIDLLKGQGVPLKHRPEGLAIMAVGAAVPVLILIFMVWSFFYNRIACPILKHELAVYEEKIQDLSDVVRTQQMFQKEKVSINGSIPEVSIALRKYAQWSPIVRAVAENMPAPMVLTNFEGKQSIVKAQVPINPDSKKMVEAEVVQREVKMQISGSTQSNCDEEIKSFRDRLRSCEALRNRIQDISVSQQPGRTGDKDKDYVSYEMRLIFKGGM
jgi:hypothetical protein